MTTLLWQTAALLLGAYFLGAFVGCLLRRAFFRPAAVAAVAVPAGVVDHHAAAPRVEVDMPAAAPVHARRFTDHDPIRPKIESIPATSNVASAVETDDADLAAAAMSINAIKGVEIGDGFAAARSRGENQVDEMRRGQDGCPSFLSNHAGGLLGGISTGQPIVLRAAFKPTSSLPQPLRTIDQDGADADVVTKGRHDPCVGIRGVPVIEAMVAFVLADHMLLHRAQCGA